MTFCFDLLRRYYSEHEPLNNQRWATPVCALDSGMRRNDGWGRWRVVSERTARLALAAREGANVNMYFAGDRSLGARGS